jgi:hypothetical protein
LSWARTHARNSKLNIFSGIVPPRKTTFILTFFTRRSFRGEQGGRVDTRPLTALFTEKGPETKIAGLTHCYLNVMMVDECRCDVYGLDLNRNLSALSKTSLGINFLSMNYVSL